MYINLLSKWWFVYTCIESDDLPAVEAALFNYAVQESLGNTDHHASPIHCSPHPIEQQGSWAKYY